MDDVGASGAIVGGDKDPGLWLLKLGDWCKVPIARPSIEVAVTMVRATRARTRRPRLVGVVGVWEVWVELGFEPLALDGLFIEGSWGWGIELGGYWAQL